MDREILEVVAAGRLRDGVVGEKVHADPTLREFVLAQVAKDGAALQHASEHFRSDREIVLVAVTSSSKALGYAASDLWMDHEILLLATGANNKVAIADRSRES